MTDTHIQTLTDSYRFFYVRVWFRDIFEKSARLSASGFGRTQQLQLLIFLIDNIMTRSGHSGNPMDNHSISQPDGATCSRRRCGLIRGRNVGLRACINSKVVISMMLLLFVCREHIAYGRKKYRNGIRSRVKNHCLFKHISS